MDLGRFFARLSLYRAARGVPMWVLVALALGFWLLGNIGQAHAHGGIVIDPRSAALEHIESHKPSTEQYCNESNRGGLAVWTVHDSYPVIVAVGRYELKVTYKCANLSQQTNQFYTRYIGGECPNGYSQEDGSCNPTGAECLAKPPLGSTFIESSSAVACQGGCKYEPEGDTVGIALGSGPMMYGTKGWKPTGVCTTGVAPSPSSHDNQHCVPAPNGQTFCIKPDGQACASASTGKQICWQPGETGQKHADNVAQKRNPGTDTTPPTPPPGETITTTHPPQTTTHVVNGTTVVTTTVTGVTGNGTNAGGPGGSNDGEPADGSGSGDGDGTGAGGGASCEDPPIVTGDAALAMVATQAWSTRCAVEAGNAANVTGDIGNCSQSFSVEGTNANAVKLRALRAQICGDSASAGEVASAVAEAEGILDGTGSGEPGDHEALQGTMDEVAFEREIIGSDIFGTPEGFLPSNAQCPLTPQINVGPLSTRINLDPLCELFINMGSLVLALAYFQGARIYAGGS